MSAQRQPTPPSSDTPVSVRLFGPFELRIDGSLVPKFATAQGQALLAYLCLNPDPHPREKLADLFWPEHLPARAGQNLRKTLSRMRGGLPSQPNGLQINRRTVQLLPRLYDVDALRFRALLDACAHHSHRAVERCAACCARLEEVVALYRGELLAGASNDDSPAFEEWLLLQRERFHRQVVDALQILIDYQSSLRAYESVRRLAQRLIELEPYQESAHAALIEALALLGDERAALAHYERCVALLADELGVAPGAELLHLGQSLHRQARSPDSTGGLVQALSAPERFHHFPPVLTPFYGRQAETAHIVERLADPNCRLLTVTGPGGIGKSRLVVEAARQLNPLDFPDGVYFVSLAPLEQSGEVAQAIFTALDLPLAEGIPLQRQLLRGLADKHALLILDNFEHLLESAPLLLAILDRAPGVSCLLTSRLPLQVQAEWQFPLDGLEYPAEAVDDGPGQPYAAQTAPADPRPWQAYSAVAFFLDRARRVRPAFVPNEAEQQAILAICRTVDGMPLALGMAAAWLAAHDVTAMAARLDRSLDLFAAPMRDLPPRHQSMRAAFAVSWDLLSGQAQTALTRLSIFRGSFDLAAAQTVAGCAPLILAQLVTAAFVSPVGEDRYTLHELLRQFAGEKLVQVGQGDGLRDVYSRYYLARLAGEAANLHAGGQPQAIERLRPDLPNLHGAWVVAAQDRSWGLVSDSLHPYAQFLLALGLGSRGIGQMEAASGMLAQEVAGARVEAGATDSSHAEGRRELLTRLKLAEGQLVQNAAPFAQSQAPLEESLRLVQQMTDPPAGLVGEVHLALATLYNQQGRRAQAQDHIDQAHALLRNADDYALRARLYLELASQAGQQGDQTQRRFYFEESVRVAERSGDLVVEGLTRRYLLHMEFRWGDFSRTERHLQRLLHCAQQVQNPVAEAIALTYFAGYYFCMGDFERMLAYEEKSLPLIWRVGAPLPMGRAFMRQGLHALYTGNLTGGIEIAERAIAHALEYKSLDVEAAASTLLGRIHLEQQEWDAARRAFARADEIVGQQGKATDYISARLGKAAVHLAWGETTGAREMIEPFVAEALHTDLGFVADRGFVYLQLFRILDANRDPRSGQLLEQALANLNRIAATIPDETYRRSFWEAVPEYRELRRLGQARGLSRPGRVLGGA